MGIIEYLKEHKNIAIRNFIGLEFGKTVHYAWIVRTTDYSALYTNFFETEKERDKEALQYAIKLARNGA